MIIHQIRFFISQGVAELVERESGAGNAIIKLVESTGNNWLVRLYHSIVPTLTRYQFMSYVANLPDRALEAHSHILDLIETGNYEQAGENLKSHIASVKEEIIKRIKTD